MLHFALHENLIYAVCGLEDNDRFRRSGFGWDAGRKRWVTPFSWVAAKAGCPADILQLKKEKEAALYRDSFAVNAPHLYVHSSNAGQVLPYQTAGVDGLVSRRCALLADEMGLGKTIQAIVACSSLQSNPTRILIVCPAALKINWLREWAKWSALPLSVGYAEGKKWPATDVVIINYDILGKHSVQIHAVKWDVLICDEAHYIKNPESARAKEIYGNPRRNIPAIEAEYKFLLSGTPILNRPIEIYPLIRFLDPHAFPDKFAFARRYCAAEKGYFGWDFSGASNMEELQRALRATVMIRRTKSQVLTQLPRKHRQMIEIDASGKLANKTWAKALRAMGLRPDAAVSDDNAFRNRLLEVGSSNSAAFEEISSAMLETAMDKIPAILDHLADCLEAQEKVVFFCHHTAMVDAVMEEFGGCAVKVTGACSMREKQYAVDSFQDKDGASLFVGNIRAAGTGLTLTAASLAVFGERTWTPGEMLQAEDRLHRIGQEKPVLIQHLVMRDSIDAYIAQTLVRKMDEIDRAQDSNFSASLAAMLG